MRPTVQAVIDALIEPVGALEKTVDTLKFGNPHAEVTGIATVFMPTQQVIEQAVSLGANLIIAHEGPFFSHHDRSGLAEDDPVYLTKKRLLEASGTALFRFHDYMHRYKPDAVMLGLVGELGWEPYVREHQAVSTVAVIPPSTVLEVAEYVKRKLDIPFVRIVGDPGMSCEKVGLLAGYRGGGATAIPLYEKEQLDLILCGEGPEWETPEYVRDAVRQGSRKALLVLGHAESEEPGMKWLAGQLRTMYPGLPVHYVKERPVFQAI